MFKQIKKLLYSYLRSVDAIWELQEETAIFLENEKWISMDLRDTGSAL
jgi:hypothetical protein